jgi:hypothetical protein
MRKYKGHKNAANHPWQNNNPNLKSDEKIARKLASLDTITQLIQLQRLRADK